MKDIHVSGTAKSAAKATLSNSEETILLNKCLENKERYHHANYYSSNNVVTPYLRELPAWHLSPREVKNWLFKELLKISLLFSRYIQLHFHEEIII